VYYQEENKEKRDILFLIKNAKRKPFLFYKNPGLINQARTSKVISSGSWRSNQRPGSKIYPS
jgi:hypothetical protein